MDFVTIDFETATSDLDSPCEIGLTIVQNSKILETKSLALVGVLHQQA